MSTRNLKRLERYAVNPKKWGTARALEAPADAPLQLESLTRADLGRWVRHRADNVERVGTVAAWSRRQRCVFVHFGADAVEAVAPAELRFDD